MKKLGIILTTIIVGTLGFLLFKQNPVQEPLLGGTYYTTEDLFESYTNGDVDGQGSAGDGWTSGWSGDTIWDVQSSLASEGSKALTTVNADNDTVIRSFTASASSTMAMDFRVTATDVSSLILGAYDGVNTPSMRVYVYTGAILKYYNNTTLTTYGYGYSADTWHTLYITWDTQADADRWKIKLDDNPWTGWIDMRYDSGDINTVELVARSATVTTYIDKLGIELGASPPAGNSIPTISSVTDDPDPVVYGGSVEFSVDWADSDSEGIKMLICKTDSVSTTTPSCGGDEWCSSTTEFSLVDPITCEYTASITDEGSNDYYAFVCDDEISCSNSSSGTFTATSSTIILTDVVDNSIVQRSSSVGSLTISGTHTGIPNSIEARVVEDGTSNEVVTWTTIDSSLDDSGIFSGALSNIPVGGWYNVQVRVGEDTDVTDEGSNAFAVGILVGTIGQSNMAHWFDYGSDTTATSVMRVYHNGFWSATSTANGSDTFANTIANATNIPVGLVNYAVGGTEIATWVATNTEVLYNDFITGVDDTGGKLEYVLWSQGESDASNSYPEASYKADLVTLSNYLRSDITDGLGGTLPIIISLLGRRTTADTDDIQAIRNAQLSAISDDANMYLGATTVDIPLRDTVHFSDAGYITNGERMAQTILYLLGEETYYRGPSISNFIQQSSNIIDVNIVHSGGSDFTPTSGITGFEVFDNESAESISSAVRQDADTIRLTIAGTLTSGTTIVRYMYGNPSSISYPVYDNTALNLPLEGNIDITNNTVESSPCSPTSGSDLWINQACYFSSDTYHDDDIFCTSSGEIHVDNAILRAVGKIVCPIITIINGGKIIIK